MNFLTPQAAQSVIDGTSEHPVVIHGKQIRVAWAKSAALDSVLLEHVRNGATRNLFVGNIAPGVTQDHLAQIFAAFGPFENIIVLRSKGIAFVNLCSIKAAINARASLNRDPGTILQGMRLKLNFAKERIQSSNLNNNESNTLDNNPSSSSITSSQISSTTSSSPLSDNTSNHNNSQT